MNYEMTREGYYKFRLERISVAHRAPTVMFSNSPTRHDEMHRFIRAELFNRIIELVQPFDSCEIEMSKVFMDLNYAFNVDQYHASADVWGIFHTKEAAVLYKLENE